MVEARLVSSILQVLASIIMASGGGASSSCLTSSDPCWIQPELRLQTLGLIRRHEARRSLSGHFASLLYSCPPWPLASDMQHRVILKATRVDNDPSVPICPLPSTPGPGGVVIAHRTSRDPRVVLVAIASDPMLDSFCTLDQFSNTVAPHMGRLRAGQALFSSD